MPTDRKARDPDRQLSRQVDELEKQNAELAAKNVSLDAEKSQLRAQAESLIAEVEKLRRQVDDAQATRPAVTFNQLGDQLRNALAAVEDTTAGPVRYVTRRAEFELKAAFDTENDELVVRLPGLTEAVDPGLLGTLKLELAGNATGEVDLSDLVLVPTLLGMTEQGAANRLAAAGLAVGGSSERESVQPVGTVVGQDPDGGSYVPADTAVDLVLASDRVTVPDLEGLPLDRAAVELSRRRLTPGTIATRASDEPEGTVVGQRPAAGRKVERGAAVDLTVAEAASVEVPDLGGLTVDEATAELAERELEAGRIVRQPSSERRGVVIGQEPVAGAEVRPGSRVALTIAGRKIRRAQVTPDVVGLIREAAVDVLEGAGFEVNVVTARTKITAESFDTVKSQLPPAGTTSADSTATIRVVGSLDGVTAVDGIGSKTAAALRKARISTIGTLAFADRKQVAGAIGGSEERAAEFIAEARDLNDAAVLRTIEGIDRKEALALVVGAGIRRPETLAQQDPRVLARTLQSARRRGEVDKGISLALRSVTAWVDAADKQLAGR